MRFIPLASSSAGNAYLVEAPGGGTAAGGLLLLECGLSFRRLRSLAGYRLHDLCGCLITHEHKDHSKCWADLIKNGVRVWASAGTIEKLAEGGGGGTAPSGNASLLEELPEGEDGRDNPFLPFRVGAFDILPFPTFHDAEQSVGYLIRAGGEKLAFATDTVSLPQRFPGVNILALEANYDRDILARNDRMPDKVKQRVQNSHMEIGTLCSYLQRADLSACREIFLLHLSDASASEGDFVRRVRAVVPAYVRVSACPK